MGCCPSKEQETNNSKQPRQKSEQKPHKIVDQKKEPLLKNEHVPTQQMPDTTIFDTTNQHHSGSSDEKERDAEKGQAIVQKPQHVHQEHAADPKQKNTAVPEKSEPPLPIVVSKPQIEASIESSEVIFQATIPPLEELQPIIDEVPQNMEELFTSSLRPTAEIRQMEVSEFVAKNVNPADQDHDSNQAPQNDAPTTTSVFLEIKHVGEEKDAKPEILEVIHETAKETATETEKEAQVTESTQVDPEPEMSQPAETQPITNHDEKLEETEPFKPETQTEPDIPENAAEQPAEQPKQAGSIVEDDLIFRSAVEARESLLVQVGKKNFAPQAQADSAIFMSTRSEDVGEQGAEDTQAPGQTGGISGTDLTSSELLLDESGVTQTQPDDKPAEEPAPPVQVTES